MTEQSNIHSTGRGGAGNIGRDETRYADAGVVREATPHENTSSHFASSGRGGAGNFGSPKTRPQDDNQDSIPESALRKAPDNYHVGRGGEGNVYKERREHEHEGHPKESLGDKIKHALHGKKSDGS